MVTGLLPLNESVKHLTFRANTKQIKTSKKDRCDC